MTDEHAVCKECRYYEFSRKDEYAGEIGTCRYNPPIADVTAKNTHQRSWNMWPLVKADAWCGKWQQKWLPL